MLVCDRLDDIIILIQVHRANIVNVKSYAQTFVFSARESHLTTLRFKALVSRMKH